MRVGVLTGGGDCPGLNAVIRAVVRKGEMGFGDEFVGVVDGWKGLMEDETRPLDVERCRGILPRGGTILGTSRYHPFMTPEGPERVEATVDRHGVEAVVVIGGEGTLRAAYEMSKRGLPIVGVPKTIDNDVAGTEVTFGFHTAVQIATDAIDRLHTTAESHDRVIVCEVMGRNVGWIATYAGIAGGATEIVVPEEPFDIAEICERLTGRHAKGRWASIVVVAEGARPRDGTLEFLPGDVDRYGHERLGGISNRLAAEIERRTGFEARVTILGHVQRGGTPTAFDRVLGTRFGVAAIDTVHDGDFGTMVALQGGRIVRVPLGEVVTSVKTVTPDLIEDVARIFRG